MEKRNHCITLVKDFSRYSLSHFAPSSLFTSRSSGNLTSAPESITTDRPNIAARMNSSFSGKDYPLRQKKEDLRETSPQWWGFKSHPPHYYVEKAGGFTKGDS
jgi:hypothetical protein